jgi:DNA excision repair protein ERCC-3
MKELLDKIDADMKQLELEIAKIKKHNVSLIEQVELAKNCDKDLLKDFFEEFWIIYPSEKESEWFVAVPKFMPFSVGWLSHTTKGYNIFQINKYTNWLGEVPLSLRKELEIKEPEKIFVSDDNLIFDEGKEQEVMDKYGEKLSSISKGTAKIKRGKEFDLIAQIIENGSLPFIPKPVESKDIREYVGTIDFKGKFEFQRKTWEQFLKTGALGIYWMTGAGKDIFSTYILDRIKVNDLPNLYVSPNLSILEQMKTEYFPKYAPRLIKQIETGELVMATYQSYDKLKDKEYGLIVFGECHVLPADSFSRLSTLKCKYRLGQSATPYREDGKTNYIFALTGYPTGLNWQEMMRLLGKKYHDVNVYIVSNVQQKIALTSKLLKDRKTIIFVNLIDIGEKIANQLGVPFIHGATKNRMEIAKESKIFVASRVMELGISLKDLEHIIEVDFLFGSRREELQRTGRLFHSEHAKQHDIIMTKEEFEQYGKRLHGFVEKGFKINLIPMVQGTFAIKKQNMVKTKIKTSDLSILNEIFEEGYFVNERQFGEICDELNKRGMASVTRKKASIFTKLNSMVKSKKIFKTKTKEGYVFQNR